MKPQALQDAIRAEAKARRTSIQSRGGWKEPHVKQHKVTEAEYKRAMALKTPSSSSSSPGEIHTTNAVTMNMDAFASILDEMKGCLNEMKHQRTEMSTFKEEIMDAAAAVVVQGENNKNSLSSPRRSKERDSRTTATGTAATSTTTASEKEITRAFLTEMKNEITSCLANENKKLRKELKEQALEIEAFKRETLAAVRKENKTLRDELQALKSVVRGIVSREGGDLKITKTGSGGETTEEKTKDASLQPHDASILFQHQRKDKELREYIALQKGLYPSKFMSVKEFSGQNIILFKNRVYIPAKLREKTIKFYFTNYANDNPKDMLASLFIWPELERDASNYENRQQ